MRDLVFAWLIAIPIAALGQTEKPASQWAKPILGYLDSLARSDGGYGWEDQPDSHLTPTFAVIGCYRLLGQDPPNKRTLAHFVRTHHPLRGENSETKQHAGELRTFVYQQIQGILWLDEDVAFFRSEVQSGW